MSYDLLNDKIMLYQLSLFKPSTYIKDEFKPLYAPKEKDVAAFTQQNREKFLIGIMVKVNFLKRLESSVYSFNLTLNRTINKIDDLIKTIKHFKKLQAENPDLDWDTLQVIDADDKDFR